MTHYDEVLKEARTKAAGTAEIYIPRLFHILVNEEGRKVEEARAIIEHDLISYWAKTTIRKNLPDAAKDEIKQETGKKGAEKKKILVLADGNRADENSSRKEEKPEVQKAREVIPDLEPEPEEADNPELEFLRDQNRIQKNTIEQLEDALKKSTEFTPAKKFQEGFSKQDSEDWNSVTYRMGIKDLDRSEESIVRNMTSLIKKDLPALRNRGWMSVEVTMRVL